MIKFGKYQLNLMMSSAIIPVAFDRLDIKEVDGYLLFDHKPNSSFDDREVKFRTKEQLYRRKKETKVIEDDRFTEGALVVPILINNTFYTTIFNLIPYVYKLYKADPSICFILNETELSSDPDVRRSLGSMFSYIKKFFDHQGIKYIYIEATDPPTAVKISRYVDFSKVDDRHDLSIQDGLVSTKEIKKHLNIDESVEPSKKVYLSRKHLALQRGATHPMRRGGENRFDSDIRMFNEELLEDYFKSIGYEVVVPEKDFKTFEEQVKYFNDVKALVSVSGSGLTNSIFMQEGTYVIDIGAELLFPDRYLGSFQVLDNQHWLFNSYINHQTFISVPTRRNPYQAVERLDKLFKVLDI